MPSLKSHFVAFYLKNTRRRAFLSPENLHAWLNRVRPQDFTPPKRLLRRADFIARETAGIPVYEVTAKGGKATGPRIMYMHGGAYCFEITPYHWRLIVEMAERLDARVTVPIYRLAPDHTFDAIFQPVLSLYREMLDAGPAENIVFMGDSAGGNMAPVIAMMAAREGLPSPGRHVLISPGIDMSLTNPEIHEVAKSDPWLGIDGGLEAIRLYAPGMDRTDWRISPVYGDLSVLPKTLVLSGTRDLLSPDAVIFVEKARAGGVDIELLLAPGMIHVWPLIDMPEARRARDRIVAFLSDLRTTNEAMRPASRQDEQAAS